MKSIARETGFSRRRFLQTTALAGVAAPFVLPSGFRAAAPNAKLNHACLGLTKTESFFAQTGPMTEAILLGTVAIRVPGRKLEWNHRRMKVTNNADVNRFLRRNYRSGWHIGGF